MFQQTPYLEFRTGNGRMSTESLEYLQHEAHKF